MNDRDLALHGLAIKRHSTAAAVAELVGLPETRARDELANARGAERAVEVNGAFALTPLGRLALESRYSLYFADLRRQPEFVAAYEEFERINRRLKDVITDWQTIDVRGSKVANDHRDRAYDEQVIDRLGKIHELIEPVLNKLKRHLPRLRSYPEQLLKALEAAEDGDIAWVSDIKRASYHTVWFELHEDLLRIMGKQREE